MWANQKAVPGGLCSAARVPCQECKNHTACHGSQPQKQKNASCERIGCSVNLVASATKIDPKHDLVPPSNVIYDPNTCEPLTGAKSGVKGHFSHLLQKISAAHYHSCEFDFKTLQSYPPHSSHPQVTMEGANKFIRSIQMRIMSNQIM